ncbi:hypothetical protein Pssp01_21840 [Pseudomonas sp. NBRC 100443]|nr:hypothetical protein Pssp01_21840 [Pseudomonas sp. NBRC 100443]
MAWRRTPRWAPKNTESVGKAARGRRARSLKRSFRRAAYKGWTAFAQTAAGRRPDLGMGDDLRLK